MPEAQKHYEELISRLRRDLEAAKLEDRIIDAWEQLSYGQRGYLAMLLRDGISGRTPGGYRDTGNMRRVR